MMRTVSWSFAVYFEFLQAAVTANTMIDMRYKISGLKITKRFQGKCFVLL